jgi:hypothetical protein
MARRAANLRLVLAVAAVIFATKESVARDPQVSAARLAHELFSRIAEKSACTTYAVSWLDVVQGELYTMCASSLTDGKAIAADLPQGATRFIVDVATAKAMTPHRTSTLGPSQHVLGYRLSALQNRRSRVVLARNSPMIVYRNGYCISAKSTSLGRLDGKSNDTTCFVDQQGAR